MLGRDDIYTYHWYLFLRNCRDVFCVDYNKMERSDTHTYEIPVLAPRPAVNPEVSDEETLPERMMRMVVSLRTELYDLYAKNQQLTEQVLLLKKQVFLKPIRVPEMSTENKDAVRTGESAGTQPLLGDHEGDRAEALDLPVVEADGGEADESAVLPPANASRPLNSPVPV
jgi:hypothetical protein